MPDTVTANAIIQQSSDCSSLTFFDASTFSAFHYTINEVKIGISNAYSTTPVVIDLIDPTDIANLINPTVGYVLTSELAGFGSYYPDSLYMITYTVYAYTGASPIGISGTATLYEICLCFISCCMRKKRLSIATFMEPCKEIDELQFAEGLMTGIALDACGCGNDEYIINAIKWLTEYCHHCYGDDIHEMAIKSNCGCSGAHYHGH